MLPSHFDYSFVHLRQKVRLRPELSPQLLSTLGPNPARKARPDLQRWCPGHLVVNINISWLCSYTVVCAEMLKETQKT